jgi:tetratricopeptide (TPR) repeat protein
MLRCGPKCEIFEGLLLDCQVTKMQDRNHTAYRRGDQLFKKGQWVEAGAQFEIAIQERPEDWQAMWALGNCYAELKKPRKAAQQFEQALTLADNDALPSLRFNFGNALFDQGQYEAAIEQYRLVPQGHHVARAAANNLARAERRLRGGA